MVTGGKLAQTILVVDDSMVMQKILTETLEINYQVFTTDNARDALSLMYQKPFSLLLLDVSMPEINGLELCRTIRNIPQFHHLPIIMVTARSTTFDYVQGQLAGATRYLTKPFDTSTLIQTVESVLTTSEVVPEDALFSTALS